MANDEAKFQVGQIIHHRMFGYIGVVFDVDPTCQATDEWYQQVARSCPPKDKPWYHVLVHDATHTTYVAEQNLDADAAGTPIRHPLLEEFFDGFEDGRYCTRRRAN